MGRESMDCIRLAYGPVVDAYQHRQEHSLSIKRLGRSWQSWANISFL